MPVHRYPELKLPRPDRRAYLDFMPGSDVPVIRQPFEPGDRLPFWVSGPVDRHHLYDIGHDPESCAAVLLDLVDDFIEFRLLASNESYFRASHSEAECQSFPQAPAAASDENDGGGGRKRRRWGGEYGGRHGGFLVQGGEKKLVGTHCIDATKTDKSHKIKFIVHSK